MLIIIKRDFITAGTKCFLEHISNCLPKATGGTGNSPMKKYFKTSFTENQPGHHGGLGGDSIHGPATPGQALGVVTWVARAPARDQPLPSAPVQSTAPVRYAAICPWHRGAGGKPEQPRFWSQTAQGSKPSRHDHFLYGD